MFHVSCSMSSGHHRQWQFLTDKFEAGQLAHAYLFSGGSSANLLAFAREFAKFLDCPEVKKPCGRCQACKLIEKESFPDVMVVRSARSESSVKNEKDQMEIDISQIRAANAFLSYTSYYGGYKILIIEDADRMNLESQHAFLKTLEEPKGKALVVLLSSVPARLLPTVLSRCQQLQFSAADGLPAQDRDLTVVLRSGLTEKFRYAKQANLEGSHFTELLAALERHVRGLMLQKVGVEAAQESVPYSLEKLRQVISLIERLRDLAARTNINEKLALEVLLMEL
jgi:DNA polymerase III delta prime subunit